MPKKIFLQYPPNPKIEEAADYQWKGGRPFLFTVSEPTNPLSPMFDVALALSTNPESIEERMTKTKSLVQTYGGFVEYIWPDDLDSISGTGSTGGFISPKLGYTAAPSGSDGKGSGRHETIAYERFQDFLELFHMNGVVFDSNGKPSIRGRVIMLYDRGVFSGHFTTFDVDEDESNPFRFMLNWEFKIENSVYRFSSATVSERLSTPSRPSASALAAIAAAEAEAAATARTAATAEAASNPVVGGTT